MGPEPCADSRDERDEDRGKQIGLHKQGGNYTLDSTLRKAFWPAAVALAAFLAIGALTAPQARAGDVVDICGPEVIAEGDTVLYIAQLDSIDAETDVEVDLDDISGDSDITSELFFDNEEDEEWEYRELDNPTDFISDAEVASFADEFTVTEDDETLFPEDLLDLFDFFEDEFDIDDVFPFFFMEECGEDEEGFREDIETVIIECVKGLEQVGESGDPGLLDPDGNIIADPGDDKCAPSTGSELDEETAGEVGENTGWHWTADPESEDDDGEPADTYPVEVGLSPTEIATEVANMLIDDPDLFFECEDLFDDMNVFLVDEGISPKIADEIALDIWQLCVQGAFFGDIEGIVAVDVTCEEAGEFELSFEPNQNESEPGQISVQCVGDIDDAEIEATPTRVEIVPAQGSVHASLITLALVDENGDPAGEGMTVVWTTDRCVLNAEGLNSEDEDLENMFGEADEVFSLYHANNFSTADAIHAFLMDFYANVDEDFDDEVEVESFEVTEEMENGFDEGDVLSAVILDCGRTPFPAPGIAKVTACVDVDGADVCKSVNVTVVGPPVAPIVLTTDQTNVRCGERVQITATIRDAAGQNVSDHTRVEVVTNAGGVLGGTGAVIAEAGLVSPVSSTVGETNNGQATFWLITSELHQGTYTVLVTAGGGGSVASGGVFSTPPATGSVTVTCGGPTTTAPTAPSPAATVRAPSTGQGITPPSTGDAGLADASGSSWALFVIAGLTVFALAGVASFRFARR